MDERKNSTSPVFRPQSNACYHFSTVARFCPTIRSVVEIGANVGAITCEMADWFPQATIRSFEPHPKYFRQAIARTRANRRIRIERAAVTAEHRYADDLGRHPRSADLRLFDAQPSFGGGWQGSSRIRAQGADYPEHFQDHRTNHFRQLPGTVRALTLDELVAQIGDIDYLKSDCEGAECSFLGCASDQTLRRIRFIAGEYHFLPRFYNVVENRLFATHYVNLVGDRQLGSFFCERITPGESLLIKQRRNRRLYPELNGVPMEWNEFDPCQVAPEEYDWHGIGFQNPSAREESPKIQYSEF